MSEAQKAYIADYSVLYVLNNFLENITKVSGIHGGQSYEIKANYKKTTEETVISGRTNSFIVLGRDRNAGIASGKGGTGDTGAAAIDLVAGHMGSRPIDKLYGENIFSDKDFKNDAARVYISQKSNIDEYFQIPKIGISLGRKTILLEDSNDKSAVAIKADQVRLISRENIKLVTFHKGLNSQSKKSSDGGIDIIAGCNAINSDKFLDLQPMVKGNNLIELLKIIIKMIRDVQSTVSTFMDTQKNVNDILCNHRHQSGTSITDSPILNNLITIENYKLLSETLPDILRNLIDQKSLDGTYFNEQNPKYINSSWNRVN